MNINDKLMELMDKDMSITCPECGGEVSTKYPYYGMNGSRIVHCKCGNIITLYKK